MMSGGHGLSLPPPLAGGGWGGLGRGLPQTPDSMRPPPYPSPASGGGDAVAPPSETSNITPTYQIREPCLAGSDGAADAPVLHRSGFADSTQRISTKLMAINPE